MDYLSEEISDTHADLPHSRVLGIPSSFLILLMFCAVIFSFGVVLFKVLSAEQHAAMREIRSVSRVFENHKQQLLREMERYAASNAAYQNIQTNRSDEWIEARFGVDMALDFVRDFTVLLDPDQNVLFAADLYGNREPAHDMTEIRGQLGKTLERIAEDYTSALVKTGTGDVRFAGTLPDVSGVDVLEINDRPHIVAAFAIVPDPGGIDMTFGPPNILITAFEIDAKHLSNLLASLSLDNLTFVRNVPEDMIAVPLQNNAGAVLGYLAWHPMSRASAIIMGSVPVLVISLAIILAIAMITLRQNASAKSRLAEREREARYAADHDSLTGFASRRHFYASAAHALTLRSAQRKGAWLIYLDLDNLKQVNDIHGHSAGDRQIMALSERVRRELGKFDLIGRVGGDEFLILTERWETREQAAEALQHLFSVLNRPTEFDGKRIETSCSAGLAKFPDNGRNVQDLVRAADIALQRCKSEQKNSFRIYDERMDDCLRKRREIRAELDQALREREFELFYQPIVASGSGQSDYFEALIRWRHPVRGLVPPGEFLPVAQEADLMPVIGEWVLEQAVTEAAKWETSGVSVNVSSSQVQSPAFAGQVAALLKRHRFAPERLMLEITEDLMLEESPSTRETFENLRALGIGLAIDDFGTGYSSMSYLHKYRFDKMKIDRSFVSRIGEDAEADMLVRSLLGLAKVMGMQTVGEGVETAEQQAFLTEAGCDYLQGYLFGKPCPAAELKS